MVMGRTGDDIMGSTDFEYIERETELPFARDRDVPFTGAVTATLDEIRYAEMLRARLRSAYQSKRSGAVAPWWCIGAD
jgi:hypothetical protein